ncbi:S1C family serine protease [Gemella haemolysans]|uniref:S1C family serine protease n=1 Tax=Gemella haemolysans TaxID=1379 RepID=UPI00195D5FA0|nr:trypsin-like peptidase domain-containing protein [Gemella haemolysans]VTX64738.1 Serine protease Do-like HtrA [Gemella haemolysans]
MENRNNNQNNKNLQDLNNQENYNEQNNYQGYQNYDNIDNSQYNNFENLQGMNNEQVAAPQKNNYGKLFLTVFAAFALGATSVFGAQAVMGTGKALNSSVTATKEDKDNQQITVNAISKAKDAVVSIVNYQSNSNNNLESILGGNSRKSGSDSSNSSELKPASSGSGVIYKKSGNTAYVVTNNHVVNGAKKLSVILSDGTNVNAEVVGTDVWTDLAVLKISGDNVTTTMDFADSDKIAVGETAFAIGSPLDVNLSNTVTKGIVSAVNRQIPMDVDGDGKNDWNQTVIQTDAAINPGNSGGALINNEGKLIGINESKIAKATANVSAEGIGFGIPSNEVKIITEQLEQAGKVIRPALGVQLVSVNTVDSDTLKSQLNYEGKQGVVVRFVENGTPAAQAGIEKYDIITKLNGEDVKDVAAVRKYLFEKTKIGDTVKVTYYRNGKETTTSVVVQALNTR